MARKWAALNATFVGKYVVVWERIDGAWRAVLDMDNDDGTATL